MNNNSILLTLFIIVTIYLIFKNKFNKNDASEPWTVDRIVNGSDVDIETVPFIVSIEKTGKHNCGGTILSADWILTAAHCLDGKEVNDLGVRAGSTYIEKGGFLTTVSEIIYHGNTSSKTKDYDIGVLKVSKSIPLNANPKTMQIASIASANDNLEVKQTIFVAGWGKTTPNDEASEHLQSVRLMVWNQDDCQNAYKNVETITERMVCIGYNESGKSSCHGDSGGPAFDENKKVVAFVSFGKNCGTEGLPPVMGRVQKYRDWIKEHTGV